MISLEKDPSLKSLLQQQALQDHGFYKGGLDNWWGAKSETAYQAFVASFLVGDGSWAWTARIDGNDIVLEDVSASYWGGDNDPLDDGTTASGVMTKGNPDLIACSLAVIPGVFSTAGSPLVFPGVPRLAPSIPWKTPVSFQCGDKSILAPLIDNGPAKSAKDAIDFTRAAFVALGGDLKDGILYHVNARILGGASIRAQWAKKNPTAMPHIEIG